MGRLLVLLIIVGGVLWFLYWFRKTPAPQVARTLRRGALWGGIGLLVLATATGRLNPIFAALAAMVPVVIRVLNLLQMLPALQRVLQSLGLGGLAGGVSGGGASGGRRSAIQTRYLAMSLDHDSGAMDGEVREGPFQGQRLSALGLEQLLRMLELYDESDRQSSAVLVAYLDREHPDWREQAAAEANSYQNAGPGAGAPGSITRNDALAILGLEPGAEAEDIRAAHRRLMQKLHPDRGGSDYLASQINAAKKQLLGE